MSGEYFATSNFEVSIEGLKAKQFTNVEGIEKAIEALPYQEGAMETLKSKKGRTSYGDITLTRRFTADKELHDWFETCRKSKVVQRSLSIIMKDDSQKEVLRFNCTGVCSVAASTSAERTA